MEVKLLACTMGLPDLWNMIPDAHPDEAASTDLLGEVAGRICYRSLDRPNPKTATTETYLANIIELGHESVLEHASATFLVTGVSRHLLGELTRHRHTSPSVESLRYCPPREAVIHPTLAEHDYTDLMERHFEACLERYNEVYTDLTQWRGLGKKQAAEAAAQFLPLATSTDLAITGNMRAWRDLLGKRLDEGANREIRVLAEKILYILETIAPHSFQDFKEV